MIGLNPRPVLKSLLGHALWPAVRVVSSRTLGGNVGLIYTFHYVGSPVIPGLCTDLFLPRETFAGVLDFVVRKLTPLEPREFLARLEAGTLPAKATMLTFDDGTRDGYTRALPELEKRGLKACFFVCPGLIDQRRTVPCLELMDICGRAPHGTRELKLEVRSAAGVERRAVEVAVRDDASRKEAYHRLWPSVYGSMSSHHPELFDSMREQLKVPEGLPHTYPLASWDELAEMHRRGMWIASHTMYHSTCHADSPERFAEDAARAYGIIETRFPAGKRIFCYPYGSTKDVSVETARILGALKTDVAFVTQGGRARPSHDTMLGLHREDAAYSVGAAKLSLLLALAR